MSDLKLLYFAGHCLALDEKPDFREEVIRTINSEDFDLNRFVFVCSGHLVLQTIYLKFKEHNILEELQEELSSHLEKIYRLNVSRNEGLLEQTRQIADILVEGNIKPIFLKGSANLLDGLYGDIGERLMGDIDFLVSDNEFLDAAELLLKAGYIKAYEVPQWGDVKKSKHYPSMSHPDYPAYIELHRLPTDKKYLDLFNSQMIREEMNKAKKYSWGIVPSDRHKTIHNFVHGQLANEGYLLGLMSLRDVYDLYLLSKRVSLKEVVSSFRKQNKVKAYFTICGDILGINRFYSEKNYALKLLKTKQKLNLSTKYFYKVYHTLIFLYQRIIASYVFLIFQVVYSKEKRNYFWSRISNKGWYASHVKLYTRFFKGEN